MQDLLPLLHSHGLPGTFYRSLTVTAPYVLGAANGAVTVRERQKVHRKANGSRRERQPDLFTAQSGSGKRCIERCMERDENESRIFSQPRQGAVKQPLIKPGDCESLWLPLRFWSGLAAWSRCCAGGS